MLNERTEQIEMHAKLAQRCGHFPVKMVQVIRQEVGQIGIFDMSPNHFDRFQIRRIAGQPHHFHPIDLGFPQQAGHLPVNDIAIHNQNELAAQVTMEVKDKRDPWVGMNVAGVELKEQAALLSDGREAQGPNPRQAVSPIPAILDRGLAAGSPGTTHHRWKHETTLIQLHDTHPLLSGFF